MRKRFYIGLGVIVLTLVVGVLTSVLAVGSTAYVLNLSSTYDEPLTPPFAVRAEQIEGRQTVHPRVKQGDTVAVLEKKKLDARLHVDLGEVRGFDYYTGVRFQAFVPGASDAVLRGGRYDGLLGRYGRPSPAVGFAVDVDAVAGALELKS